MREKEPLIPRHGGYRNLKTFQIARLIYDVTVRFCDRYVDPHSRTHDQMVQAARSGVQNIAEGSKASGTSKKMELKLTNVANASLAELRLDYEDYLRRKKMPLWDRSDPRREELISRRCKTPEQVAAWVHQTYQEKTEAKRVSYSEIAGNGALTLIDVTCGLLDRQIASQARDFEKHGGFTERLYRIRTENRNAGKRSD